MRFVRLKRLERLACVYPKYFFAIYDQAPSKTKYQDL
jgi:hypothetical protein